MFIKLSCIPVYWEIFYIDNHTEKGMQLVTN